MLPEHTQGAHDARRRDAGTMTQEGCCAGANHHITTSPPQHQGKESSHLACEMMKGLKKFMPSSSKGVLQLIIHITMIHARHSRLYRLKLTTLSRYIASHNTTQYTTIYHNTPHSRLTPSDIQSRKRIEKINSSFSYTSTYISS